MTGTCSATAVAFKPAWWCRGAHMQTLWPKFFSPRSPLALRRERLELPDGDFLDIDWTPAAAGPIVLLLHGLQGSGESHYARALLRAFDRHGWRGGILHFRGCSGEPNRLARGYHSGETGDVAHVIAQLRQREPNAALAVVGVSLGGNVLVKWLGELGLNSPLAAAVAISVPYQLGRAASRLDRGFSRLYQRHLLKSLRRAIEQKRQRIPLPLAVSDLSRLRNFRDFDTHVTAALHGFRDAEHYYQLSSARQYVPRIATPTLLLHALDDPFMTPDVIPAGDELPACVTLDIQPSGGHVGFVGGNWPWRARYWLTERVPAFLAPYLTERRPQSVNTTTLTTVSTSERPMSISNNPYDRSRKA
jgi:uncharacterized protein